MRDLGIFLKISILAVSVLCASCARPPDGTISSRVSTDAAQPKKIYIHASLNGATKIPGNLFKDPHDEGDVLAKQLTEAFSSCGIESKFVNLDPLALTNPEPELVKEYDPDSILNIIATTITRSGNLPISATFQMTLIEKKTNTPVWKADANVNMLPHGGRVLAKLIINSMQKSNLISSSCQIPPED